MYLGDGGNTINFHPCENKYTCTEECLIHMKCYKHLIPIKKEMVANYVINVICATAIPYTKVI